MDEKYLFKVNLGGMIDILSNHLYSSPDVFVRELLQNAVDAVAQRQRSSSDVYQGTIKISADKGKSISFRDNGKGLTVEEIHKFLAVIGQSSKHDVNSGKLDNDYIGRFGIGLLSCFLVSDEIVLKTRAAGEGAQSVRWCGRPDGTYTIDISDSEYPVGTEVYLKARDDSTDYFDGQKIAELVKYYGLPLPFPIYVDGVHVNEKFTASSQSSHEDVMEFGKSVFGEDFLDYIPLQSPDGLFSGVAFILPYPVSPTNTNSHRIYLKNMLLTESSKKLLPEWAFFLRCFINTSGLRPVASREDFYSDERLDTAREQIADCISQYLEKLDWNNKRMLDKIVSVHSLAVKSIAAQDDELFNIFIPYLKFETSAGNMTGEELMNYPKTIRYTVNVDTFRQISPVYSAQDELLVNAGYVYESDIINKLRIHNQYLNILPLHFSGIEELLTCISQSDSKRLSLFISTLRGVLDEYECEAELRYFEPSQLASVYVPDENALAVRDINNSKEKADEMFYDMLDAFASEYENKACAKLYLNLNNSFVKKLSELEDEQKLRCCTEILYVQAIIQGSFPMRNNEMKLLNNNLMKLLEWSTE